MNKDDIISELETLEYLYKHSANNSIKEIENTSYNETRLMYSSMQFMAEKIANDLRQLLTKIKSN